MDAEIEQEVNSGLANALKVPIYAAKKQHYEILKSIIEGVDVLCNSATYLKYIPDEPNVFNVYEEVSKEYASLGHQVAVYKAQVEKIEMLLEQGTLDTEEIDEILRESLQTPQYSMEEHEFHRKFRNAAGIGSDDEDDEVTFQNTESVRSITCPVTQMDIVNPLRNAACGHTYSEQGIRAHLKRNKKCPVAGCQAVIQDEELERDVEMEVIISRTKNSQGS
uniref:Uncharacterized protein AlNc14C12G1464 n=1 Tax=Albugo laibachii Nc14 TaxID=890382 RepID=F0W386_9STRA|nr:conserved hypothetical protein [Albugo laibachii Nc14]|eukprot:CCA15527.1 conserved hypothetical protein [Albugo laibachii Nc14]